MSKVTGDSRLQSEVLEDLRDAHNYRRWLADLARPYLGPDPIEVGSGTGDYALEWVDSVRSFTATEGDDSRLAALAARFAGHPKIRTRAMLLDDTLPDGTLPDGALPDDSTQAPTRHSALVAINVLEHIPQDVEALRAASRLVASGGAIVLLVPAVPAAMSRFDRAIGHQRRYTRPSLAAAMRGAGLRIQQLRYVNPIGLLSWFATVKALGLTPRNGPALRIYDRTVVPVARALDRIPAPFGQSLFAVGRVP